MFKSQLTHKANSHFTKVEHVAIETICKVGFINLFELPSLTTLEPFPAFFIKVK